MTFEDLEFFFEYQLQRGNTMLMFTIIETIGNDTNVTYHKHDLEQKPLDNLIPFLENCLYVGRESGVPRFRK